MSKSRTSREINRNKKSFFTKLFRFKKAKSRVKVTHDNSGVTFTQQIKSPTLSKIHKLAKRHATKDKAFNSQMLYQLSDEIKWYIKQDFMNDMNLHDVKELEKACRHKTDSIKKDIIQAKKSDVNAKWIQQEIDSVIYINVHVHKIKSIEERYKTVGAWLYKSSTDAKYDLSDMKVVTNKEIYGILQKYFDDFVDYL